MMTSRTIAIHLVLGVVSLFAVFAAASPAAAQDPQELRERQAAQQRAQAMTREMVSGIFEVQLRQLSENGLADTELYTDIATMRENVDLLVDEEMSQVIDLLAQAQRAEGADRQDLTEQAREKTREIMVVLMAERQKLRRRLQISNIASQVETLILIQSTLNERTFELVGAELSVQETNAIARIEDQRDVRALYFELVETLNDVSGWGGDLGVGAQDGLRILRAAAVENHLDEAIGSLEIMQFAPAAESQLAVLHGLEALMLQVQETQGLVKANREAVLESVRDLIVRQKALREETSSTSLSDANVNPLISEQNDIHQEIGGLDRQLDAFPGAPLLLEQAKAAAFEATGKLFDLQQDAAVAHQSEVIAALEQLTQRLESAMNMSEELSADELEEILEKIKKAREELEEATPFEEQALQAAQEDPLAAAEAQREAAREMAEAAKEEMLPASASSRLREAAEAAEEAADALEEAASQQDDLEAAKAALRALEDALDAHERAAAELAAQESDTERKQLAVEVGELARAAEALERAAAAERRIADRSIEAAEAGGYEPLGLESLVSAHEQVTLVVTHVQGGVVNTAPEVAQMLAETEQPIAEIAQQLAELDGASPAATIVPATQISLSTELTAEQLVLAAAALRALAGESAEELAELASEQLQQVSEARREIEDLVDEVRQPTQDTANLQKALAAVLRAEEFQWRAMGRSEAASLHALVRELEQAVSLQGIANRSAEELAAGRSNTPLEAIDRQQRSADHLSEIVDSAPEGSLRQVVARANSAAQEAARQTLAGNNSQAAAARAETATVLAEALDAAQQAATASLESPAAEADAQAQQAVSLECNEARTAVGDDAPEAAEAIEDARRSSQSSFQQINTGDATAALPMQENAQEDLTRAEKILRQLIDEAAARQSEDLAKAGEEAGELARKASEIDPDAADALRDAQRGAQAATPQSQQQQDQQEQSPMEGGEQSPPQSPQSQPTPQEQQEAREELADDLQRSAASMAAREEQIRRDQGVAEALAKLAERQQEARDAIDEAAQELEDAAEARDKKREEAEANGQEPQQEEMTDEEKQAAEDLNQAMRDFARAQKQTGQGAQEISQQENVENEELKKGLEAASQLPEAASPPPPEEEDKEKGPMDLPPPTSGDGGGDGNSPGMGEGSAPAGSGGEKMPEFDPDAEQPEGPPGSGVMPVPPGLPPGPLNPNEGAGGSQAGPPTGLEPPPNSMASTSGEETAQEIAGQDALQQALEAMQQASQSQSEGQGGPPMGTPPPGGKGAEQGGPAGVSTGDVDPESLGSEEDPWFADLPPEIQEEIQSGAQGRSPRGYEERLRRYHQSVE